MKEQGLSLDGNVFYKTQKNYDSEELTFEAEIYYPEGFTGYGGVIMGNYSGDCPGCNYEIGILGNPQIFVDRGLGMSWVKTTYEFNEVNIYEFNGKWVHLAIVKDIAEQKAHCYIDGMLKQTINYTTSSVAPRMETVIGSDNLYDVGCQYFLGCLRSIRLYSDVRSATEIISDYEGKSDADNLLASYDFTKVTNENIIKDSGNKGYDLVPIMMYMDEGPVIHDYDYSIAVVGDPQVLVEEWYEQHPLHHIYDYILKYAENRRTKFVITVGDYVTWNKDYTWKEATEQLQRLDGVVPYNIARGNHDDSEQLNRYLPWSHYRETCGGSYDGRINNTWQEFTAGHLDYLVVSLDYGAEDCILDWASEVIEAHPHHNVIVVTHSYLSRDNQLGNEAHACPPLYFSEGGSKVQVEYYSTVKDKWYTNTSQFTMNVNVIEK